MDFNPSSLMDYIKARNDADDEVIVIAVPIPRELLYTLPERDVISGVQQMAATMSEHAVKRKRALGENSTGIVTMNEGAQT